MADISSWERAASALVGYVMGSFVVVPFDRVKTLVQAAPGKPARTTAVAGSVYSSAGLRGLYRGLDTQLLIAPYTVLYYSIYDELLKMQGHSQFAPLTAAMLARTVEVTVRMPLELMRTQLQAAEGQLTIGEIVRIQRQQPLSEWMRGYSPTLLRDVPFSGIYWFAYEEAKKRVVISEDQVTSRGVRTFLHSFFCGGSAGMFAAFVTTPVDVIKTLRQKLQATPSRAAAADVLGAGAAPASAAYGDIVRFLASRPTAAFAGLGPRLLRVPLGLATMMSGIETCKWSFERRRQDAVS